jgi:membrane-associated phospholipid phosphatase
MPRPVKYFEAADAIRVIEGYATHSWRSFPSGHSASALALAAVLAYLLPARKWGFVLVLIFVPAAYSRVYLAQHFFQDIYAGAVIGVLFTWQLIWWLNQTAWYRSSRLDGSLLGGKQPAGNGPTQIPVTK